MPWGVRSERLLLSLHQMREWRYRLWAGQSFEWKISRLNSVAICLIYRIAIAHNWRSCSTYRSRGKVRNWLVFLIKATGVCPSRNIREESTVASFWIQVRQDYGPLRFEVSKDNVWTPQCQGLLYAASYYLNPISECGASHSAEFYAAGSYWVYVLFRLPLYLTRS